MCDVCIRYLILFILIISYSLQAEIMTRAAFDFGSGKMKLQVAEVDIESNKIVRTLYSEGIKVLLAEDAGKNPQGCLSQEIQNQAIASARYLKEKAIELGATEFLGLATEVYRKASNGQQLVDRYFSEVGIPVTIISQLEEAKLGFLALAVENDLDPSHLVSWDIGGGSSQITYLDDDKNVQAWMISFGRVTGRNAIITFIKGKDPAEVGSPNPMNAEEWERSIEYFVNVLPLIPEGLVKKLKQKETHFVGISAHPAKLRNLSRYTIHDIEKVLAERLNKDDDELSPYHSSPSYALSELALVYAIMKKQDRKAYASS